MSLPTTGTTPEPCSTISAIRTSNTLCDTPSFHPTASAISGGIRLAFVAGTAGRNWRGPAHLKRAWMSTRSLPQDFGFVDPARAQDRAQQFDQGPDGRAA